MLLEIYKFQNVTPFMKVESDFEGEGTKYLEIHSDDLIEQNLLFSDPSTSIISHKEKTVIIAL